MAYSNGRSFTIAYDANGNPTSRTEKLSGTTVNTTSYTYDKLNRRTTETFPSSQSNTYAYDKAGNLASLTDGSGTTTYAYDDINRLTSITSPKLGTANCTTAPSSCDAITYAYSDLAGSSPTANGGATSRTTLTYPGSNLKQISENNASGQPTSLAVKNFGGTVLQGTSYTYLTGTAQQALISAITQQPANTTTSYSYDNAQAQSTGALLGAQTKNGSGVVTDNWSYAYDAAGNRKSTVHNTTTTSFAFNAANQMCWAYTGTTSNACATAPSGATTYAYDHAGNQITGALTYDALSRMTGANSATLGYLTPSNNELDAYGTTSYQNNLAGLGREIPSSGSPVAYTRTPDGSPVAQRSTTTKQYLFADQLGSITASADNNTNSLGRSYSYDPDGNRTTTGTGTTTNLGYAGGLLLPNGLYHYGARYYNPTTARFTQQDPLNQITDNQQANRYAYVGGNPVNNTDPEGQNIIGDAYNGAKSVARKVRSVGTSIDNFVNSPGARCAVGAATIGTIAVLATKNPGSYKAGVATAALAGCSYEVAQGVG